MIIFTLFWIIINFTTKDHFVYEEHGFLSKLPKVNVVRRLKTLGVFLQGKGTGIYEQCYYGPQKQYRVTKLSPASRYAFRLAAKNDMGVRSVHLADYF